jgi:hypothetical protein
MNSVSKDYSGDLAGMLFGVSEPLNFESRISDRERQVENTNLHCLSCTMYMPWLRICGLTNIFIPVPQKYGPYPGRVEGGRSVRSLTHIPLPPIHVPALRERAEDIPFLVRHFAQLFARNMKKQIDTISTETMNALVHYPWPGNIREMQNVIECAVILSRGPVLHIPSGDLKPRIPDGGETNGYATLEEVERRHILSVLEQTNWIFAGPNGAAARLGLKRPTLQFRMQKLGITRPQRSSPARTAAQST